MVVISYLITLWLNSINIPTHKLDYIIILGCGVIDGAVPPLLESRIRKGIAVFERNPHSILVMSGGRGPGEDIAEAEAMQKWAVAHNVDPARILVEDRSRNTQQNIRFSKKLISEDAAARYPGKQLDPGAGRRTKIRVAVVTSRYHLLRGLLLARDEHLDCIGYGARTRLYFSINAFVREFVGYLSIHKKFHLITVSAIVLLYPADSHVGALIIFLILVTGDLLLAICYCAICCTFCISGSHVYLFCVFFLFGCWPLSGWGGYMRGCFQRACIHRKI